MSTLHPPVGPQDHSQGPEDAPVTLVEFGDYQCPYCGEAFGQVKELQQQYGDRLRFVFRNFPLTEIHDQAMAAAVTAEYCGSKGKFWEAHDALYENQQSLGGALYEQIVQQLGLDVDGLQQAADSGEFTQRIQDDLNSGIRSGVNGTPSFYVNGHKVELTSDSSLSEAIERALG